MTRRRKNSSKFGASVSNALAGAKLTQSDLAGQTNVSRSYIHQVVTGRRVPSGDWINIVASTLKLQESERTRLHSAAAYDLGFDVDLTKE